MEDDTDAALAAFGLQRDKPCESDAVTNILPCNMKTVRLFVGMGTQWRIAMHGATGLDYSALPTVARVLGIRLTPGRFEGLRIMENEVLRRWERKRE